MDLPLSTYGADESGLICGYVFEAGQPAVALESRAAVSTMEELRQAAARPGQSPDRFLWLHFNLSHAGAARWLERHAGLSPTFYDALKDELRSTRIERDEEALVAVVNDVHFDFSFEASDIATLWISLDSRVVVTARQSPLRSIDQLRIAIKGGEPIRSTVELLERLLRAQADVLVEIMRNVTRQIDKVEDDLLAGKLDLKRAKLGTLRRLLVRLQRLLAPEPASLFRLLQHPPHWMAELDAQQLREATEEFSVALRDMASLQERIKLLQEEVAAIVNEQNSRSLFVLTVVTVLALPINILAGLFGMNVGGVPLAQNEHGFWVVVGIVAAFTLVAGWVAFRRRGP
ncbi:MAG TPA: transporter [Burkholderiaceae bacterium]|nr:transporter [Burkholderiaceae bacterium]